MITALLLSGGRGERLASDIPKQYITVGSKMIIEYSLITLLSNEYIDSVRIVATEDWQALITECIFGMDYHDKFEGFSKPGDNRQLSIYNGLLDMKYNGEKDFVLIHDAARPLLSADLIERIVDAGKDYDGVLPTLPMKDTIYYCSRTGKIDSLLDRDRLVAGQAPEMFNYAKYLRSNESLLDDRIHHINGSTEPAFLAGMDIVTVQGDENNFKITTNEDLDKFKGIIEGSKDKK